MLVQGDMPSNTGISPHAPIEVTPTTSVRSIYIHNLVDLLHTCLLRGLYPQAKRAWAILVRCREVDWKSRWYWGLLLLEHDQAAQGPTQSSSTTDPELWLRNLQTRVVSDADKPAILHARVLHMIQHNQHRQALNELQLWLVSYPYASVGPLHTYAGLLSFYLAQPPTRQPHDERVNGPTESPDESLLREARTWFAKALEMDTTDKVASDFLTLIDHPDSGSHSDGGSVNSDEDSKDESDLDSGLYSPIVDNSDLKDD